MASLSGSHFLFPKVANISPAWNLKESDIVISRNQSLFCRSFILNFNFDTKTFALNIQAIPLEQTNRFSGIFTDYLQNKGSLKPFFGHYPSPESFREQLKLRIFSNQKREILTKVLHTQHMQVELSEKQRNNLDALKSENTFTITTGHQLCLATGPVYFIYKILTAIKLAEELCNLYQEQHFVPVFWMASEDHDLEEISHFHLFGKKYEWQPGQKGSAGKLSTIGLRELFDQIPDCPGWLKKAYTESDSLSAATRQVCQYLFGKYGLLILDGDDRELKQEFKEVMLKDLLETRYAGPVRQASDALQQAGYKAQAYVRDQNFFYLLDGSRERIEKENSNTFRVLNTDITFSLEELKNKIETEPENFSPNVLMRPLYQETILPNLAYIGGPGELAYWLQLKPAFDAEGIPFPVLFPRKFVTVIPKNLLDKIQTWKFRPEDFFLEDKEFSGLLTKKLEVESFDFNQEDSYLNEIKKLLLDKAARADKSLLPAVEAEVTRISKGITELGKRINKALENKHQTEFSKIQNVRSKLFPEGGLQERHDNFLNFQINDPAFIDNLYKTLSPFSFKMDLILL